MAKSFSIYKAIGDGFVNYGRNWLILTLAGAVVSSVFLIDHVTGLDHLKETHHFFKNELKHSVNASDAWNKTVNFHFSVRERFSTPGGALGGILIWFLLAYAGLGIARMCLQILSKGKTSLEAMITNLGDFLRYLGAGCVLITLCIVFGLALSIVAYCLHWLQLPLSVIFLAGFVIAVIFVVYMLHFIFLNFCMIDKSKGVMGIIECSKKVVAGNLSHMVGFIIISYLLFGIATLALGSIGMPLAKMVGISGLSFFLVSSIMTPINMMAWASVYRQLK